MIEIKAKGPVHDAPSYVPMCMLYVAPKVGGGKPKMRYYFGENGWPKSKLGAPPETDQEKDLLIDSLQVCSLSSTEQ